MRKMHGPTWPAPLRTTTPKELRRAKAVSYTAANAFESACMDADGITADRLRHAVLVQWTRRPMDRRGIYTRKRLNS